VKLIKRLTREPHFESWEILVNRIERPRYQRPVGRNKLAQFRQPYGKRTAAMPELRKLVPAYIFRRRASTLSGHKSATDGPDCGLSAIGRFDLSQDVLHVLFDCLDTNRQRSADVTIA